MGLLGRGRGPSVPVVLLEDWQLPPAGSPVDVEVPEEWAEASKVDHLVGGRLVLAAPAAHVASTEPGSQLLVRWRDSRGQHSLFVRLAVTHRGHVPLWELEPTSTPSTEQRRAYVRAFGTVPVHLTVRPPEARRIRLLGSTVDLSEVASRVRIKDGLADGHAGSSVTAVLDLPGCSVAVEGSVAWVRPGHNAGLDVLVMFDLPVPDAVADVLRRTVFDWQRTERMSRTP